MQYLLTFLEGLASFISPCLLPMIPLYLSYFAGSDDEEGNTQTKGTTDENIVVTADENIVATVDVQPKQVKKRQTRKVAYRRPVKRENRKDDKKIFIDTDNSFSINAVSKRRTEYEKKINSDSFVCYVFCLFRML